MDEDIFLEGRLFPWLDSDVMADHVGESLYDQHEIHGRNDMHPYLEQFPESPYVRESEFQPGWVELSDGEHWFDEKNACHHCCESRLAEGKPPRFADEQYSMGIYAGKYCDDCWSESGYVKEGAEAFDPGYAGETYWEDQY